MSNFYKTSTLGSMAKLIALVGALVIGIALYFIFFENKNFLSAAFGVNFKLGIAQTIGLLMVLGAVLTMIYAGLGLQVFAVAGVVLLVMSGNGSVYNVKSNSSFNTKDFPAFDSRAPRGSSFQFAGALPKAWAHKTEAQKKALGVSNNSKAEKFTSIAIRKGYKRGSALNVAQLDWCKYHAGDSDNASINCNTGFAWKLKK